MATGSTTGNDSPSLRSSIRVLEEFANSARIVFDRTLARRVLAESIRGIPGNSDRTWDHRLVEIGESLNLRVRSLEVTIKEVIPFIQQGIPVAHCRVMPEGDTCWWIITRSKGGKVKLLDATTGEEHWVNKMRLAERIGLESVNAKSTWVIGQPALGCQTPGRPTSEYAPKTGLPPLKRIIQFMAPEKGDLWILGIFAMVAGLLALAPPLAVEVLVNTVAFGKYLQPVIVLAMMLFIFLAFAGAMNGLMVYVSELLQRRMFVRVVEDLAYRLPRVNQQELDKAHGPELVNRFFDIVTVQKVVAALLLDGLAIILQTIIGMMVLAFYHPFLLGFDIVLLLSMTLVVYLLGRGAVKTSIKESKCKYAVAEWMEELVRHPTAFKLHSGQHFAMERADQLAISWLDARQNHFRILLRQILFVLGLKAVAATVLLGIGGWLVITGELTLGQLVAAELIVMMIVGSYAKMGKHMEGFYDLMASIDKLGALFDLSIEPHDKLFHLCDETKAEMKLRNVTTGIGGKSTLQGVSFEFSPHTSLAITGPCGSGKSLCIDLLCGLRTPNIGHVELDGIDLRELRPDSLREHIAVARNEDIFHGTIRENVHLNRTNVNAADVRNALAKVDLLDELLKLPDGLDTMLQTHGSPLSTSQTTRLMLARAIIGSPRVLLIDGTLDALPDELAQRLLATLSDKKWPWALCLATSKRSLAGMCDSHYCLETKELEKRSSFSLV